MSDTNRIGEACWYKDEGEWRGGTLRMWAQAHEEYETGPGHFPVAVIEDAETKRCLDVSVLWVSFAAEPPTD